MPHRCLSRQCHHGTSTRLNTSGDKNKNSTNSSSSSSSNNKKKRRRNDMLATVSSFVDDLPPFYATAAWYHVGEQRRDGGIVNLDSLAAYFSELDKTASTATRVAGVSPSKNGLKKMLATDTSPPDPSYIDFAPSRPRIADLLHVDQRSPETDDERSVDCVMTCSPP
ncbi:uncharacterized protein EHS24_000129 [Apiotrichum porosum]|uniref:Uncharacterized protein n=1 Tax=Apiotrichum porosum TaxID=105984 RepID=A0A427Y9J4_9TREE|nr:uncharacterized protein EHS24_000129 [Apiotrichum porosum]RSH87617.1 hypothetical protein EHS24_000129 [Apiotrichum porosum]